MLNYIKSFFTSVLKILEHKIKELEYVDTKKKWDLETGEKFNDIINKYPVTEEVLLKICKEFSEYYETTLVNSIKKHLWIDYKMKIPRLPWMIKNQHDYFKYIAKENRGDFY